jgi:phosphinothricin acetyltransferase
VIRAVTNSDAQAICDIYNYYITDTVVTFEEEVVCAQEMCERISKVKSEGHPWLIAEDAQGNILGYAYATNWPNVFLFVFLSKLRFIYL